MRGVPAPADVLHAYGAYGIAQAFWDTTYAPDFPTAAKLMSDIWTAGGGEKVDGVIAGDPSLMAGLLSVVGPVSTPVWPETITKDNVQQIVGADVYKTTSGATSDAWELGIGKALWAAVLTRPWPMQAMSAAISAAAKGRHLQVWSPDPSAEATLQAARRGRGRDVPRRRLAARHHQRLHRQPGRLLRHDAHLGDARRSTGHHDRDVHEHRAERTAQHPAGHDARRHRRQAARHVRARGDALHAAGLAAGEGHGRRQAELSVRGTAVRAADDHGGAAGEPRGDVDGGVPLPPAGA